MAAGDFLIRRNNSDSTSTIPNAGGTYDTLWDTEEYDEGSAATYSAGTFTLTNTAPYLIIYSERFTTSDTTNNERIEGQGRIRMNSTNLTEGASEGYIRKSSGHQTMVLNGMCIYDATANDSFDIRFYRGDNSTTGTVDREAGYGGVQIIELDPNDNFADYTTTANHTISSTEADIPIGSTVTQETGFSRSGNDVTISSAGRYLMILSGESSESGTSRLGARVFLERGTTEVTGVQGYTHIRGADGNQNGAISFAGIVDVSASDTFTLRGDADSGSMVLASGAHWQWWQLPSGNETAIMEATTGNMNVAGDFEWDTLPHIDTSAFTATAGNANIDVDQGCHLLMFWNQGKTVIDSLQRAYPTGTPSVLGSPINYAQSGAYHRNSGSIGTFCTHSGASILHTVAADNGVTLYNAPAGATGTVDTEKGHFSLLNLEGLYKNYSYTFPTTITDVDTDEVVTNTQTNVVITGVEFGATQGTGTVELVQYDNYTGTKITQSVDSWSDTSIQIDISAGALADTFCFLFVTTNGSSQDYLAIQVGLPPETYQEAVEAVVPEADHYWTFQNTYADELGTATANNAGTGTSFETKVLVKGDTHSLLVNATTDYCSSADQGDMNTSSSATHRYMGGWIQLDRIITALSVIWEEGAQVNNYAFLVGYGNFAMWQFADDGGDYVQAYHDIKMTPNRPYHVMMEFKSSSYGDSICACYLDGVKQTLTNGNPWEVATFPSHSGNISWGHEGTENLQTGDSRGVDNVDIAFASPVACNYAHWYSWNNLSPASDIREELFAKGALADETILANTTANMQTAVDALADTVIPDWPCGIEIRQSTNETNFSLTFDNITFNSRCSLPIRYVGNGTLTIVLENGADLDESKCEAPYGGSFVFQRPATFTVAGLINGCEIRIYDDDGGPPDHGTELDGTETLSGTSFQYSHDGTSNAILVQMIATGYEEVLIPYTLDSTDQVLTVEPKVEENS